MGLIKEPKTVDFQVIDNPWTASDKQEFSLLIRQLKLKKGKSRRRKLQVAGLKTRKVRGAAVARPKVGLAA